MTALALERTDKIRIGTGAILLPYYSAQKVTEAMGLLSAVHPDRVDTGVGRASLSDPNYAVKVASLVHELDASHAASSSEPAGRVWVLGAGGSSAPLPGTLGAGYVHGHFLRPTGGEAATSAYREAAVASGHTPHTVLAVALSPPRPRNRLWLWPKPCCSGGFARILGTTAPFPRRPLPHATSGARRNAPELRSAAKH